MNVTEQIDAMQVSGTNRSNILSSQGSSATLMLPLLVVSRMLSACLDHMSA